MSVIHRPRWQDGLQTYGKCQQTGHSEMSAHGTGQSQRYKQRKIQRLSYVANYERDGLEEQRPRDRNRKRRKFQNRAARRPFEIQTRETLFLRAAPEFRGTTKNTAIPIVSRYAAAERAVVRKPTAEIGVKYWISVSASL
ncbi:MAG: hypothetical protein BJ554DRAFT_7999 [Olpidium bornovanus]|uniref:Uncharacterized protein n=1 Tax=Olpidium bornovanus TaxID=278681 RepID=A0A8H7ZVM8_9FUNG|nr:MAG: hypothetical protein BJ554DRAFT_7999 [Olpidium bornovanus]